MACRLCPYCNSIGEVEREHVVPRNLFPTSIRNETDFVLVDSCRPCNNSFSSDEEDFRNYCTLAGPENAVVMENFHGPVLRGIRRNEGRGSGERLFSKLEFVEMEGKKA